MATATVSQNHKPTMNIVKIMVIAMVVVLVLTAIAVVPMFLKSTTAAVKSLPGTAKKMTAVAEKTALHDEALKFVEGEFKKNNPQVGTIPFRDATETEVSWYYSKYFRADDAKQFITTISQYNKQYPISYQFYGSITNADGSISDILYSVYKYDSADGKWKILFPR